MDRKDRLNRVLAGISHTGYTTELERDEARILLEEQDKEIQHIQSLKNKATNYYLKTLAKNGSMPEEAVKMFNLLEENIK